MSLNWIELNLFQNQPLYVTWIKDIFQEFLFRTHSLHVYKVFPKSFTLFVAFKLEYDKKYGKLYKGFLVANSNSSHSCSLSVSPSHVVTSCHQDWQVYTRHEYNSDEKFYHRRAWRYCLSDYKYKKFLNSVEIFPKNFGFKVLDFCIVFIETSLGHTDQAGLLPVQNIDLFCQLLSHVPGLAGAELSPVEMPHHEIVFLTFY